MKWGPKNKFMGPNLRVLSLEYPAPMGKNIR